MILGFKERFKQPILTNKKIHTIREDIHNRWRAGMKIHMATGVRTKKYNQFAEQTCKSIQHIVIIHLHDYDPIIRIDERQLSIDEIQQLAWNDGFENIAEFFLWFHSDFKGKIIHWTNLTY